MYDVQIIQSLVGLEKILDEWKSFIESKTSEQNMYQDPNWVLMRLRYDKSISEFAVVIVRKSNSLSCVAPFYIKKSKIYLTLSLLNLFPFNVRIMKVFGDSIAFSNRISTSEICYEIFQALFLSRIVFDFFQIDCLPTKSQFRETLRTWCRLNGSYRLSSSSRKIQKVHLLKLRGDFDAYLSRMSRKRRYNIKREVRKFAELERCDLKIDKVSCVGEVESFLRNLERVSMNSWQTDVFGYRKRDTSEAIRFHKDIAAKGWLRSYLLKCSDEPIAFILGYQYYNRYYFENTGFNKYWRKHSPGSVLNYFLIKDIFANDRPDILDFGFGDNQYKRMFGTDQYDAEMVYVTRRRSRGEFIVSFQYAINMLSEAIRSMVKKMRLENRVRSFLRRSC